MIDEIIVLDRRAACLVRGVAFDHNDPEIRGADIFQRLVPMKTLEATSVYSEHKASLLRGIVSEVEDKNTSLQYGYSAACFF
ncbi:hypothetical protein AHF37_05741 [Paragonimus kellicotti]|nr:hypothetical protein AHF37_05741 [Paragonimus kellicotti]